MNWKAIKKQPKFARARRRPVDANGMNKTEAAYAAHLAELKMVGQIRTYWFQPMSLVLPGKVRYVPDFLVVSADFELEFHEIKGAKKVKDENGQWAGKYTYWAEDDAKIKVRIAAGHYPEFKFAVCYCPPGADWIVEEIGA